MFAWCLWLSVGTALRMPFYRLQTNQIRAAAYTYALWLSVGCFLISTTQPSERVNAVFSVAWVVVGIAAGFAGAKVVQLRFQWLSRITHALAGSGLGVSNTSSMDADALGLSRSASGCVRARAQRGLSFVMCTVWSRNGVRCAAVGVCAGTSWIPKLRIDHATHSTWRCDGTGCWKRTSLSWPAHCSHIGPTVSSKLRWQTHCLWRRWWCFRDLQHCTWRMWRSSTPASVTNKKQLSWCRPCNTFPQQLTFDIWCLQRCRCVCGGGGQVKGSASMPLHRKEWR